MSYKKPTIIISFFAIIISSASLYYSCSAIDVARSSYELQLEPIIRAEFYCGATSKKYILKIYNDGPTPITDIKIYEGSRIYNTADLSSSSMLKRHLLMGELNILEAGDSLFIPIPYQKIIDLTKLRKVESAHLKPTDGSSWITALLINISYRKIHSMEFYLKRKFLFLSMFDQNIAAYDPERWNSGYKRALIKSFNDFEDTQSLEPEFIFDD